MSVALCSLSSAVILTNRTPTALQNSVSRTWYAVPFLVMLFKGNTSKFSACAAAYFAHVLINSAVSTFVSPKAPKTKGCTPPE